MNTVDGGKCFERKKPISFISNSFIIWSIAIVPANPAPTNPTKIVVDYQAIMASLIEDIKPLRDYIVTTLDYLKVKATANNKTSVVSEIDADITALKACLTVDLSNYTKAADLKDYVPDIMAIDYNLKYEDKINA